MDDVIDQETGITSFWESRKVQGRPDTAIKWNFPLGMNLRMDR